MYVTNILTFLFPTKMTSTAGGLGVTALVSLIESRYSGWCRGGAEQFKMLCSTVGYGLQASIEVSRDTKNKEISE